MGKRNPVAATVTVSLHIDELSDEQAWQLAQFCKRITFGGVRECATSDEEAYTMLYGISRIARALRDKGFAPR